MIKLKHIFLLALVLVICYGCPSDNPIIPFDHEAQAVKDKDTIAKFLKTHYYKDAVDSIKKLETGKTALINDTRLKSVTVNEYDIDYTYYYFVKEQGISNKGFPTVTDSILTLYRLSSFTTSNKLSREQDLTTASWFNSAQIAVRGWLYGFTHFKPGNLKKEPNGDPFNGPITYEGGGKGFFLLPSGLSYRNGNASGLANKNLLYIIDFYNFVEESDNDNDNIASILEDINGDGKPWNDDTDGDSVPNFLDTDDDGDGVLTKKEDANKDGNPRNDFSDPNNPTLPDYLNPNIK